VKMVLRDADLDLGGRIAEEVRKGCFPRLSKAVFDKRWQRYYRNALRDTLNLRRNNVMTLFRGRMKGMLSCVYVAFFAGF